ncbi:hypothetical protein WMY93_006884 [Mugilogobius chulae]|uniref:Uncharacterized protein n=1 Tax=Mugilogobius chulae TaxID=88201 RepID=A0AAW0PWM7_9GOBI
MEKCSVSAGQWVVPGKPCVTPTPRPPTITTCDSKVCDILTSSVFQECNQVVPVAPYKASCVSEVCEGKNETCPILEAYAGQCASAGICSTGGTKLMASVITNVQDKKFTKRVVLRYNTKFKADNGTAMEGCFCADGTTEYKAAHPECVSTCDVCEGPDGKPRQPGETWTTNCKKCLCDNDSLSTQCTPVQCPTESTPSCSETGQQVVNKTVDCCNQQTCECNTNLCPKPPSCAAGFKMNVTTGVCCQEYECVPKGVCVHDNKEYKPGDKIPSTSPAPTEEPPLEAPETTTAPVTSSSNPAPSNNSCKDCYCTAEVDTATSLNIIKCTPVVCNTVCSEGFTYEKISGKCCGHCVQKQCVIEINNATVTIEANETYVSPDNKCVKYKCEKTNDKYVTEKVTKTCPPFNPLDCKPGTETTDADGCCKSCTLRSVCEVRSEPKVIEVNGCKSDQPVNMTSCFGHCGSSSIYSESANSMMRKCECCQETATTQAQVALKCADGTSVQHNYSLATACACTSSECVSTSKRRRRR